MAACVAFSAPATSAETIRPTRFNDPVPDGCKPDDCSLREAITKSNKHAGTDKVKLAAGTYKIQIPENVGDDNKGGDFDVIDRVVIAGKGPETVVDGQDVSRVFSLLTFSKHTLKNLTVEDGSAESGGGILAGPAQAVLRNVVVRSNTGTDSGGGLYTVSQDLKILRSAFLENGSPRGGGIYMPTGVTGNPNPSGRIEASTFADKLGAGLYLDAPITTASSLRTRSPTSSTRRLPATRRASAAVAWPRSWGQPRTSTTQPSPTTGPMSTRVAAAAAAGCSNPAPRSSRSTTLSWPRTPSVAPELGRSAMERFPGTGSPRRVPPAAPPPPRSSPTR